VSDSSSRPPGSTVDPLSNSRQTPPSIEGLSLAEKRILLARLLQKKSERGNVLPMSHGQRGLWVQQQLAPHNPAYNMAFPSRVRSQLDVAAFHRSLQALVDRHPSLRTTFCDEQGELVQVIHDKMPVAFEVINCSSWDEASLQSRLDEESRRPFDLENGPLLRAILFSRAKDDHVFLAVAHHIILDFWSLVVAIDEIRAIYPAQCEGRQATLPPLAASYADFVRWQNKMLESEKGRQLRAFWEEYLDGAPHVLELPADRPRPADFSYQAGIVSCALPEKLTAQIKALAGRERVTVYSVLLSAYQLLLSRYSGQLDFLVGTPFVGRSRPGFEQTVGYFVNLLPLRADLRGDPTYCEYLQKVGSDALHALDHQDLPFPLMVEHLQIPRDSSRPPLVQVSFTLEKSHRRDEVGRGRFLFPETKAHLNVGGILSETHYVEPTTCRHELELVLEESGGAIQGLLCYCADLFSPPLMQQFVQHYQTTLESVVANPTARLSQLDWFSDKEKRQVIHDWNQTREEFTRDACLHELFEQQVRRTPDAVAMSAGGNKFSYKQLDGWANRLACRLQSNNVEPGHFVVLCMHRSPEIVAMILAVLKAGAVCVPADPKCPIERLKTIVEETGASLVVSEQGRLEEIRHDVEPRVLTITELDDVTSTDGHPAPPSINVTASDLAYVIYTSGSTGLPKGVMVEHRAICNTIQWRQSALKASGADRVLMMMPCFFDASFCVIFSTLTQGAQLVLAEPNEEFNPAALLDRLIQEQVTVLPAPPRLLSLLVNHPSIEKCHTLRQIHTGGEKMAPELLSQIVERLKVPLVNLYGPTETAVEATYWECPPGQMPTSIPIGRPIANVQAYVLDGQLQPVPVGVPGELYIGGAGLARGYLNDDARTAERFLPNPFDPTSDSRIYRTGDFCRWLANGHLEFLGRLDRQIKLRGYRIELTEIEHVLTESRDISEAAVTVHTTPSGEPQLMAYVVPSIDSTSLDKKQLLRALRHKLPTYMIPALIEQIERLPRLSSGKLDRQSLPAPRKRTRSRNPYQAPNSPLEQYLTEACQTLLKVDRVGVCDSFYELGGSSIQGAMLLSMLQEELDEQIKPTALFDLTEIIDLARYLAEHHAGAVERRFGAGSVAQALANEVDNGQAIAATDEDGTGKSRSSLLVPIQPRGTRAPLFMVHPPGGIVVCYQPLAFHLGLQQPTYGIRARGLHGEDDLPEKLEEMAAEYVTAIQSVQPEGPYQLGGWSLGGVVALEMAQQLKAAEHQVGLLAFFDTTIPQGQENDQYIDQADNTGLEYGLDVTLEQLGELGPDEQLPYLWEHARKLGILDDEAPEELVQQVLNDLKRLFHSHLRLACEYRVRPYQGRITLFRPSDAPVEVATTPDRGWKRLADDVDVEIVPGQHHSMVKEPHVEILAERLSAYLQKA
jgi:amino acid adenylation domain-containing protein